MSQSPHGHVASLSALSTPNLSWSIVVTRGDDWQPVGSVQGPQVGEKGVRRPGLPSDPVDEEAMRRRVADARVGRLATVTPSGLPHIVPCCFVLEGDTIYSAVDHKPKSTFDLVRLVNLQATRFASLLVDHYDEDWSRLWWVRIDGRGRVEEGGDTRERALGLLAAKYEQYRQEMPAGPAVVIEVTTWRAWP
jgi:PPOX class probable F420-dependent enzyme